MAEDTMAGMMLIISPDGSIDSLPRDSQVPLETLQAVVGGSIQLAGRSGFDAYQVQCVVNEEGRLRGMPANPFGTQLATILDVAPDDLVGMVVLLFGAACMA